MNVSEKQEFRKWKKQDKTKQKKTSHYNTVMIAQK